MTVDKKVLDAYKWFMESDFTGNEDNWGDIVLSNQGKFEIAQHNDYFKVEHADEDNEPRWDKNETDPKKDGYKFIKRFYFGTVYYVFKKI